MWARTWLAARAGLSREVPAPAKRLQKAAGNKPRSEDTRGCDAGAGPWKVGGRWCGGVSSTASSFQSFHIGKEIVNVRLCQFAQQLAMSGERVMNAHLDLIAPERTIPARGIAKSYGEFIQMLKRALERLAGGQGHSDCSLRAPGIKHLCFQFQGLVLGCNVRQIA